MSVLSNCNPNDLRDAVAGTLDPQRQQQIESHIATCNHCQQALKLLAADQQDWNKISDYFVACDGGTQPYHGQPTVDIQLVSGNASASYELVDSTEFSVDHSQFLEPASHPEMLGRIDSFEVEQLIGQGGMGVVYKGFDTDLNRPVAIKVLAEHLAANGVARQRFAREARAAAAVMHPNVVPIHSVNSSAKRPYIVMTLVSGRSLQAHIRQHGPLPVKDIVRIGKQIAAGLAAAHREGLVHRDIKPANILLEKDVSRVMITDFGLARAADDAAITQTGWLAGTPHYMSPEQSTGQEVDGRSDLFSLGSVLYFMCTGREPFRADIPIAILQKINSEDPVPVRSINSDITSTLANLIQRLLCKNPEHRFQSAEEVEQIMTQYLAHLEQPRLQPKPKFKQPARNKFRWVWFAIPPVLLIGLTIALPLIFSQSPSQLFLPDSQSAAPDSLDLPDLQLMTDEQWQNEIRAIDLQLKAVEANQPHGAKFTIDPFADEQESIQRSLQNIEQQLR